MSEAIKPDLVLPMKRCWFARIWNGEKTVEYRQVKPYWQRRIGGWDGQYYRLHFAVVGCYLRDNGEYLPMLDAPRMKEVGHVST